MECADVQMALSARTDGEETGLDPAAVDDHLARCARCRAFGEAIGPGDLPVRLLRAADPAAPGRVVAAAAAADRSGVWWLLRLLLGLVAVGYLVAAVPELVLGAGTDHDHLSHHLGIFAAAYAVALLVVSVRPARARAMVPFTATLAAGMAVVAVVDLLRGEAFPLAELSHGLELAGLVLVWLLATRRGWPGRSGRGAPPGDGPLRSVPAPSGSARTRHPVG